VPSPREEVLEVLEKLVKLRLPNLLLCATSRHELDIPSQFVLEPLQPSSLSLHDEEGQREDIRDTSSMSWIQSKIWEDGDRRIDT
jgi:hypothetical protein